MSAATEAFDSPQSAGEKIVRVVPSGLTFYPGTQVALTPLGVVAKSDNVAGLKVLGIANNQAAETENVVIDREPRWLKNSATSAIVAADVGRVVYVEDDTTVASTTTNKALAGVVLSVATIEGVSMVLVDPRPILPVVPAPVVVVSADGPIPIINGTVILTKGSAGAQTLAAPTAAQEGTRLTVISGSAFAHVIAATDKLHDGVTGGAKDTATFAAFQGASITLIAYNLLWYLEGKNLVTIAAV